MRWHPNEHEHLWRQAVLDRLDTIAELLRGGAPAAPPAAAPPAQEPYGYCDDCGMPFRNRQQKARHTRDCPARKGGK